MENRFQNTHLNICFFIVQCYLKVEDRSGSTLVSALSTTRSSTNTARLYRSNDVVTATHLSFSYNSVRVVSHREIK